MLCDLVRTPATRSASMLALGLTLALRLGAASQTLTAFHDLDFGSACMQAAKEEKIVFVDFYTTWCAPCKMLDQTTWPDPRVVELLRAKTVALKIDAEKNAVLARRYKITAYPTLLLLKPDGTVIERLIGYRNPDDFISEFAAGLEGRGSNVRTIRPLAIEATTQENARTRYELGKKLAREGQDAEALAELLWCFDEGMVQFSRLTSVRNGPLLDEIARIGARHPPARDALVERRDALEADLIALDMGAGDARSLASLNRVLGQDERTFELFTKLPAGSPPRRALTHVLFPQLLAARRYADALTTEPYKEMVRGADRLEEVTGPPAAQATPEARTTWRQSLVKWLSDRLEVLAGAGQIEQARAFLAKAQAFDSSPEANATYLQCLTRAGRPELFQTSAPSGK